MKRYWKFFIITYGVFLILYLGIFFFSTATLMYYEDHYAGEAEFLSWPHLNLETKLAVLGFDFIGFPLGPWAFIINALLPSLVLFLGVILYRKLTPAK